MDHKMPTDNGPEEIKMKQAAAFGLFFAAVGTAISAMNDMFGWMIAGLILVLVNIMLLTSKQDIGE